MTRGNSEEEYFDHEDSEQEDILGWVNKLCLVLNYLTLTY